MYCATNFFPFSLIKYFLQKPFSAGVFSDLTRPTLSKLLNLEITVPLSPSNLPTGTLSVDIGLCGLANFAIILLVSGSVKHACKLKYLVSFSFWKFTKDHFYIASHCHIGFTTILYIKTHYYYFLIVFYKAIMTEKLLSNNLHYIKTNIM